MFAGIRYHSQVDKFLLLRLPGVRRRRKFRRKFGAEVVVGLEPIFILFSENMSILCSENMCIVKDSILN